MVRRCKTLVQYSAFVERVRRFLEELGDREKAMRAAITYCRYGMTPEQISRALKLLLETVIQYQAGK
jgi:transposase-like protein